MTSLALPWLASMPAEQQWIDEWERTQSGVCRRLVQEGLLFPLMRAVAQPYEATYEAPLETTRGPFVIVANHTSHVDMLAILAGLPRAVRQQTAVAAADDYFYRSRVAGALATRAVGTFPFPRHGGRGLARARALRRVLDAAEQGRRTVILRHGKPVAVIAPIQSERPHLPEARKPGGLLALLSDWGTLGQDMADVIAQRQSTIDRPPPELDWR